MTQRSTRVALDTNFLLLPFQRRIDVFEEIERLIGGHVQFIVLNQVLQELNFLIASGKAKERAAASGAIELIRLHCQDPEAELPSLQALDADTALLHYAKKTGAVVATNDQALRHALVKQGSRAIFLRKLAVLAITE